MDKLIDVEDNKEGSSIKNNIIPKDETTSSVDELIQLSHNQPPNMVQVERAAHEEDINLEETIRAFGTFERYIQENSVHSNLLSLLTSVKEYLQNESTSTFC